MNADTVRRATVLPILAAALVFASARAASAQPAATDQPPAAVNERIYFFGAGGYNTQADDESELGTGAGVEGGIGYRVTPTWSLEAAASHIRHTRALTYYATTTDAAGHVVPTPYSPTLTGGATFVLAQVRHAFSTSRVRPYIAFGGGMMHYSGDSWAAVTRLPGETGPVALRTVKTVAAASLGGGVEVAVGRRISLGPYVSAYGSGAGETGTSVAFVAGMRVMVGR